MSTIKDIIQGFFSIIATDLYHAIRDEANKFLDEFLKKSTKKIFNIGISLSIISIGLFLFFWGIASYIDTIFKMTGFGFILIGIIVSLIGILVYEKFCR